MKYEYKKFSEDEIPSNTEWKFVTQLKSGLCLFVKVTMEPISYVPTDNSTNKQ